MDPSDFIRDSFAEGASSGKVLRMLMAYYDLSEEEAQAKLDKYLDAAEKRGVKRARATAGQPLRPVEQPPRPVGQPSRPVEQPPRPPVRDPEQLKKDAALDRALYLVPNISLLVVLFVCADLLAGFMYYLQDGIDSTYLSSVLPKHRVHTRGSGAYLMLVRWPVCLVMWPAAHHLLEFYPREYDEWLKKKREDETSNVLFRKLAWSLVLIMSFIFQIAVAPPDYKDAKILLIYRAVSIGLVVLALVFNHIAVHLINRNKYLEYCGVTDRFSKTVDYTVIAVLVACVVVELFVLPVIAGVQTTEDIIFAIIALIVIAIIGYAVKVGAWFFGPRNP